MVLVLGALSASVAKLHLFVVINWAPDITQRSRVMELDMAHDNVYLLFLHWILTHAYTGTWIVRAVVCMHCYICSWPTLLDLHCG